MSFMKTFLDGAQGAFKPGSLSPIQKLALRFVIVGLAYYGLAAIEGMIMRIYQVEPVQAIGPDQFFAILTAHPLVGIFGSTYLIVFGVFLFFT